VLVLDRQICCWKSLAYASLIATAHNKSKILARHATWLGGEDSNPQWQGQNLQCCRLHHPRIFALSYQVGNDTLQGNGQAYFPGDFIAISASIRLMHSSRPTTAMQLNNGGPTVRPVIASLTGACSFRKLVPRAYDSSRKWRSSCSASKGSTSRQALRADSSKVAELSGSLSTSSGDGEM
jgi:hypothetical protein